MTNAASNQAYYAGLVDLSFAHGAILDHDKDAPMPFAVWLDDDIIGAGDSASEAVADARKTVQGWES